jgi:hypothetical protein
MFIYGNKLTAQLLILVAFGLASNKAWSAGAEWTLADIERAWQERQDKVWSGDFRWSETRVSRMPDPAQFPPDPFGTGRAPQGKLQTFEHTYERRLVFSTNGRYRQEDDEPFWSKFEDRFTALGGVTVTNEAEARSISDPLNPKGFVKHGVVMSASEGAGLIRSVIVNGPILHHFQPLQYPKPLLAGCVVVDQSATIDGVSCVVVRGAESDANRPVYTYWLDPQGGFCILRRTREQGGILYHQLDVTYKSDVQFGPVPGSWKMVSYRHDGSLEMSRNATVIEYTLNRNFPNRLFEIEYPKGALIVNQDESRDSSGEVNYVALDGGRLQRVSRQLLRSAKSPGEAVRLADELAHGGRTHSMTRLLGFFFVGLVLAAVGFYWVRRVTSKVRA